MALVSPITVTDTQIIEIKQYEVKTFVFSSVGNAKVIEEFGDAQEFVKGSYPAYVFSPKGQHRGQYNVKFTYEDELMLKEVETKSYIVKIIEDQVNNNKSNSTNNTNSS